ncbi:Site-specific recombinase XerD [Lutimaribacter pacificus]|uniref:Site-specific recombinase XerD n=1 Tax=Lutimaribacter pacificus TaxID=391948 RepID=A0A1H0NW98_9RHOB|nr:site-specific integrase [Lutimaribacter pacificus]SDO97037.1 Site-specific recombinase XerD [Lutimaribacter pacificus]SHK94301.1 Site-specific recombinase XerD [Lutimaribacter pacificus]
MFKLTKRAVESLEAGERDYLVWDCDMRGFGLRVYPSGKKTYLVQYRSARRTRRVTIGQHGVLTAEEARKEARRLLGDVARGDDPSAVRQAKRRAPTVAGLCDRFLEEYVDQHCKPTTARDYQSIIRRFIRPKLGPLQIAEVTRADVVAFHHGLRETPYQANRAASMLSKLFNLAEDWGLRQAGSNPARRIKKFREEEKKRFLSDAEQIRLGEVLAEVIGDGSETIYTVSAIILLIYTGCRLNEILTLRWSYVAPHHLELPDSKTGKRRVPLPREAYDLLTDLPRRDGNPYVILGESEDGPMVNLQKPWRRIRGLAGLDDVRLHDLRHTYASVAMQSGVDPFTLKEIMGHKNLQTTLRYAHLQDDAVQRAAGSVATRLAGAIGKGPGKPRRLHVVR